MKALAPFDLPDEWVCEACGERVPILDTVVDPLSLKIICEACDDGRMADGEV